MAEKNLTTRIKHKTDTSANWAKAVNFVPLKGEIIVYSDLRKIKVGDGTTKVNSLQFLADSDTHQAVVDKNPTLSWGTKSTVATIGDTSINVTMPANPNTHQSIKTLKTDNTAAQATSASEAIAGSGTINLHKVAKTGSYNDLNNKPDIDKINNEIDSIKNTYLSKNEATDSYVKKLGTGTNYRVYMVSPDGTDTSRVVSSSVVNGAVPIRTSFGQLALPDQSIDVPVADNAISLSYADRRYQYQMDGKTTDFHSVTTLRWLDANNNNVNEMVLNGNILLYNRGKLTASFYPDYLRYKTDNIYWSELVDLVSNKAPLLNGDKGAIGSYTSAGNGVSSVTTFAGEDISNTAKGINSFSLGRLNAVEGVGCLAYGNKNTIKGAGAIALGGGNTSGDKIDWTSASASVNNSSAYCISLGENNTTIGRSAVSVGISNKSNGDGSISIGRDNTIWSKESVAIGRNNTLNKVSTGSYDEQEPDQGNGVVAIGTGLKTPLRYREVDYSNFYWNCVISGRYNDPYAYNCVRSSDLVYTSNLPPLFTLGNGLSDTSRNNAIVLFHNASAINSDFIYFNEYSIFNKKCEFRGSETIIEGTLKDASGAQYIKGGTITASFINSLF